MRNVRFALIALLLSAWCVMAQPAKAAYLSYVGVDMPWLGYGWGFGSSYNASSVDSTLNTIRYTYHCNYVRIWACEGLDGLIMSGNDCKGFSSVNASHIADFVGRANGKGMKVEVVFINFLDVQQHSSMITWQPYATDLVWNGLINLCRALSGKDFWIDLINEGNLATNTATWSQLRWFGSSAVNAMHNQGFGQWVTMSDQNPNDFLYGLSGTVGGVGYNFYEYHAYNTSGYIAVGKSNVGGQPIMLGEYGPSSQWMYNSASSNQSTVNNFINNASNLGYMGAAAWAYLPDGSNWQLQGNNAMWNIEYWAAAFGH